MRTLLLFDGLGGNTDTLLPALAALRARPENDAYFTTVSAALDDVLDHVGPDVRRAVLPGGLPLERWLRSPADAPPDALHHSRDCKNNGVTPMNGECTGG